MFDAILEAKKRVEVIKKKRSSVRFKRVIGRLLASKIMLTNTDIKPFYGKVDLKDFLWGGLVEPRIFEVLPAIIIKKPSLLNDLDSCPPDLHKVVEGIRKGEAILDFRGVRPVEYLRWVSIIGHKGVQPSLLKSFRFQQADLEVLKELTTEGYSEIDAVREGLRLLLLKTKGG